MSKTKDDEPVIVQDGKDAEEKFRFSVEKHVIGKTVKGLTYSSAEDLEGKLKTTIRLDFEDGEFLVIAIATESEIDLWLARDSMTQPISKLLM